MFYIFISSISAIDIGDSVFVMTAAKTYDSRNIQFLNVTDPESIYVIQTITHIVLVIQSMRTIIML